VYIRSNLNTFVNIKAKYKTNIIKHSLDVVLYSFTKMSHYVISLSCLYLVLWRIQCFVHFNCCIFIWN